MSRWTTLGPACSWFGMCLVTHGIFQRAWIVAFGKDPDAVAAAAGPDVDDAAVGFEPFSVTIGRRITKVCWENTFSPLTYVSPLPACIAHHRPRPKFFKFQQQLVRVTLGC
eukprot:3388615-Lingulodinium_polyedra.AAC.2